MLDKKKIRLISLKINFLPLKKKTSFLVFIHTKGLPCLVTQEYRQFEIAILYRVQYIPKYIMTFYIVLL